MFSFALVSPAKKHPPSSVHGSSFNGFGGRRSPILVVVLVLVTLRYGAVMTKEIISFNINNEWCHLGNNNVALSCLLFK